MGRVALSFVFGIVASACLAAAAVVPEAQSATVRPFLVDLNVLMTAAEGESLGAQTQEFKVNSWSWPSKSLPVPILIQPENSRADPNQFGNIVRGAMGLWNDAGAKFAFEYLGGAVTGPVGACEDHPDGFNVIGFVETLPRSVLAVTCTYRNPGRPRDIVEFDMRLNAQIQWSTTADVSSQEYDLATAILHELGHAAGLSHSSDPSAVMYSTLSLGHQRRALTADDRAGLAAVYGPRPGQVDSVTPTAFPHRVIALGLAAEP